MSWRGSPNHGGSWMHGERAFRSSLTPGERNDYDKMESPRKKRRNPLEKFSIEELENELKRRKTP